MRSSIRWRLVMMYVMMVVIVMMVSGTMIVLMLRENEENALAEDLESAVEYIKVNLTETTEEGLFRELKSVYESPGANFLNKRVFVLGDKGQVVLPVKEAALGWKFSGKQVTKAFFEGTLSELERDVSLPIDDGNVYLGYADAIKAGDDVVYVVYALGDMSVISNTVDEAIDIILLSVAMAFFIAILLGFVFSDLLTKPITALSMKARDMATGQLDRPMKVYSNDEIGQLTLNFNKMAKSLNETLNEVTSEKNKLEIVFEHMTDGILVFDRMGVMIHSNPASVHMLKLGRQISFQEVFKPFLEVTYTEMKAMVMDETISHLVEVDDRFYSVYFAKFIDQGKEAVGLICVIQDITEHKHLEAMQKEFVANVSHELRTPLTTIKSYAETLMDGSVDDPETAQRFLSVINHEGDRMTALVQDLLELSKLDNSQITFTMIQLNLEHLVDESVDKYRMHAKQKRQSLLYHPPGFDCKIIGDMNRIEQVLKNIVTNAVKYSPEEALIEVGISQKSKYYVVRVSDNGFGIPKEELHRIFDRFYRVDKARSREMGGTGLGLAIAKEIMEQHGGKIEVKSEFGRGTTFDLYFPKTKKSVDLPATAIE